MKLRDKKEKNHLPNIEASANIFSELVSFDAEIFACQKQAPKDTLLIGLDEVGRGCIAGPVTTAAYSCVDFYHNTRSFLRFLTSLPAFDNFLDENIYALLILNDSKKVPHHQREMLCEALMDVPSLNDTKHIFHAVAYQSAANIDGKGIVECIWDAMTVSALEVLSQYRDFYGGLPKEIVLLVDGPQKISNLQTRLEKLNPKLNFFETDFAPEQENLLTEIVANNAILVRQVTVVKGDSRSASIAAASNLAKSARDKYMKAQKSFAKKYNWITNVGYGTHEHYKAIELHGLCREHRKSFLQDENY